MWDGVSSVLHSEFDDVGLAAASLEEKSTSMTSTTNYLALDLGAESGRGLLGRFNGESLSLEEGHRFSNSPVQMLDTLYWDLPRLFGEIKTALRQSMRAKSPT